MGDAILEEVCKHSSATDQRLIIGFGDACPREWMV